MWTRMVGILLLSGAFGSVASAADELSDLLDKGRQASSTGDYDEAERVHLLAVDVATHVTDPARQAEAIGDLGGVFLAKGRFHEARDLCLKALNLLQNTTSKRYLPIVLNNLGALSNHSGDYEDSERYFKEAIRVAHEVDPNDPYVSRVLNNLAVLYYTTGHTGSAEKALKEAIAVVESKLGKDRVEAVLLLANLAEVYIPRRNWKAAKAQLDKALSILETSGRAEHIDAASVLGVVGRLQFARDNFAEAANAFRSSYAIRLRVLGADHPAVAVTGANLAAALVAIGSYEEAERLYAEALKVLEKAYGPRSLQVAATLEKLTQLYRKTHREVEAEVTVARAEDIRFELQNVVQTRSLVTSRK